ncbi:hypothetical protein IT575_03025 [bacterium]|nr:hypothetical protein [bacterium]
MISRLHGLRLCARALAPLLLAALSALLAACANGPGGSVSYPPSWPLSGITAPPGSKGAPLHFNIASEKLGPGNMYVDGAAVAPDRAHAKGGTFWALGFSCEEQWSIVENHFRACLRAEGLKHYKGKPRKEGQHVYGCSTDGEYELGLFMLDQERYPGGWEMRITRWNEPLELGLGDYEEARLSGEKLLASR